MSTPNFPFFCLVAQNAQYYTKQIWTLQVVLGGVVSTFVDGPGDSLWCNGAGVKFGWRGGPARPAPVNWSKTSDPLTIVSADTWIGVHTPGANGGWAKTTNIPIGSYSSTAELCIGGGIYDGDNADSRMKIYAVRVYDRVLSDAEIAANDIVDQARFYGKGTVPPLGESAYVLSGTSDLIKRDAYVTLSLDQIDEPTEIDVSARLTLGGFDLGARAFAVYAVFGDGTEQQVATGVKSGDSVGVKVEGLVPDAAYAVRFYAKDATLSSPMTQERAFVTPKPVLHPAQALEGGRLIRVKGFKTKKGFVTGVDLAFGACPDDWTGDLYVAYGQRSGFDLARAEWAHFEKLNEAPVTAADKTFHYDMPEGWRESIWSARFFFETHTTGFVNASSYYVQDGLIAMFDGIDNVGTGVHDPNATAWVDLMGNGYDISVWPYLGTQLDGWTENSLAAKACKCVPLAKSCEDYVTIEIFLKHDGKYQGAFYAGSRAKGKIVVTNNDTIEFYNSGSGSVYSLGDRERAHAAAVYSPDATNPIVYTKGALATVRGGDAWGNLTASTTCLGMAYNSFHYSGEWYLVRLYDRALTAEEIAQNYRVDCLRYGYGDAEGELETIPADRRVLSSSSETIYAGRKVGGFAVILR